MSSRLRRLAMAPFISALPTVFASADHGEHWQIRGRAGSRLDGVVQKIVPDSENPARLLAAVWYQDSAKGGGVFESFDGARHWTPSGFTGKAVRALENSESDPRVWFAGTARDGVFRSLDGAHTWQRITSADNSELQSIDSLAVDPSNPQIVYVGTFHLPWKTLDGGKTWTSIASGMIDDSDIMSLRIDTRQPRRIFSSACSGIYRSDDAGGSWTKLQGIPYASRRTQQIVQDHGDPHVLYAATTQGLWRSADSGENWNRITNRETAVNGVLVLPLPGKTRLLIATEADGVMRSDGGASSFTGSNQGFLHRVIDSLAADPHDSSHLLARLEGSSSKLMETYDAGASWTALPPVQSDATQSKTPLHLYSSTSGWWVSFAEGGLAHRDFPANIWTSVNLPEPSREQLRKKSRRELSEKYRDKFRETTPAPSSSHTAVVSHATSRCSRTRSAPRTKIIWPPVTALLEFSHKLLAATDDGIWMADRHQTNFTRVQAKDLPRQVTYLSPASGNSLYAIADGLLWTGDLDASSWKQIPAPQDGGQILWIAEIANAGTAVRLAGTERGVFRASSGADWHLLSNGLPAISSQPISISRGRWLVAMSNGGSYLSVDFGKSWDRGDTDSEQGRVTAVLPTGENSFFIASQSEGLLRLTPLN